MSSRLTPEEVAAGDELADALERMWGWYLGAGIVSLIFGFVVLSYKHDTLYALAYFAGAYFVAAGVFELVGSFRAARHRWLYLAMGVISVGVGIACLVWPHVTLFVVAVLIGWVLLFWGTVDLVDSLSHRHAPWWWVFLVRGIVAIGLGIWAIRHPGDALVVLVVIIGLWAIVFGVIEILAAFAARHARRNWEETKAVLGG